MTKTHPYRALFGIAYGILIASASIAGNSPTSPLCTAQSTSPSNFNGTPIPACDFIWFNANFQPSGVNDGTKVFLTGSSVQFTSNGTPYNVPVPDAVITFSNSATCASTCFDQNPETVFSTQTPVLPNQIDGNGISYELGMKFQSAVPGQITAIRYWKAPSEPAVNHIGNLWDSTGTLLATVNFVGETASGWQQQALATPLNIQAGRTYVVSVNITSYYVDTVGGLATCVANGDLSSMADGNNGVFSTTAGGFPTQSFQNSNYFRDIVFVPAGRWKTTVPLGGSDEIFLTGGGFPVPANLQAGINPVTWKGTFSTNTPGIAMQWKWGAAVYKCFPTDYNLLYVKPTHQNACDYNNGDHAGTPENSQYQQCVTGGARGGGGSNFTGSWSSTVNVTPVCPP